MFYSFDRLSKYPWINTTGVPLSPEPLVKSQSEPTKSVILLGVVPKDIFCPTKLFCFSFISLMIAFFRSLPVKLAYLLSATYLSFISFGVPISPSVKAGDTTGSASSQILPTGSLKAPSP